MACERVTAGITRSLDCERPIKAVLDPYNARSRQPHRLHRADAKEKKTTMETYRVPGVNNDGRYSRWAFAEFTDVYAMQTDFETKVEAEFNKMIQSVIANQNTLE